MLSPVTPLQPVKLIDLRSLQVLEIPSIALRLNAEFHPPEFQIFFNECYISKSEKTKPYPGTNPEL